MRAAGARPAPKEEARELNYCLDSLEQQVHRARQLLIDSNREITAAAIKSSIIGTDEKKVMLFSQAVIRRNVNDILDT